MIHKLVSFIFIIVLFFNIQNQINPMFDHYCLVKFMVHFEKCFINCHFLNKFLPDIIIII